MLIPNLVMARVCSVYITSEFEVGSDKVKECNFEKDDIMKISTHDSKFFISTGFIYKKLVLLISDYRYKLIQY